MKELKILIVQPKRTLEDVTTVVFYTLQLCTFLFCFVFFFFLTYFRVMNVSKKKGYACHTLP